MHSKWIAMNDRIETRKSNLVKRYPNLYLLVCVHTGRFALGDPLCDTQGGYLHASQMFICKHGTMEACGENHRDFLGVTLKHK